MAIFYTTINGNLSGRASYGFEIESDAQEVADAQNARAENLGIKARYEVWACEESEIQAKEIR